MELIRDNVKVEWVELGEGLSGDYNPDDPEDIELLRFDVSVWASDGSNPIEVGEWEDPGDASYCTQFPANTSEETKQKGLEYLMNEVYEPLSNGHSIKKLCERLSWISPEWVN